MYVFLSSVEKNMKYVPADVSGKTKLRLGTNIKYYPLKKIIYVLFLAVLGLCSCAGFPLVAACGDCF